jgi:anti-sigma factor RsiW
MQVTRDVILDLLPIYCADEATRDTRALVEEFLKQDPSLATQAAEIRRALRGVELAAPSRTRNGADFLALERVRRAVRRRGWYLGAAIFFSALPCSFYGNEKGIRFLWTPYPAIIVGSLAVAAVFWILYFRLRRKLGV